MKQPRGSHGGSLGGSHRGSLGGSHRDFVALPRVACRLALGRCDSADIYSPIGGEQS
jgi:hypothetical protein